MQPRKKSKQSVSSAARRALTQGAPIHLGLPVLQRVILVSTVILVSPPMYAPAICIQQKNAEALHPCVATVLFCCSSCCLLRQPKDTRMPRTRRAWQTRQAGFHAQKLCKAEHSAHPGIPPCWVVDNTQPLNRPSTRAHTHTGKVLEGQAMICKRKAAVPFLTKLGSFHSVAHDMLDASPASMMRLITLSSRGISRRGAAGGPEKDVAGGCASYSQSSSSRGGGLMIAATSSAIFAVENGS